MKRSAAVLVVWLLGGLACSQGSLPGPLARCLGATPEPFWVEPVPAATNEEEVTVEVHVGSGEQVTVVTATGAWIESGQFDVDRPALVRVRLLPDTTHRLAVTAWVAESTGPGGCKQGGYTLSTTVDKNGGLLAIVQLESK